MSCRLLNVCPSILLAVFLLQSSLAPAADDQASESKSDPVTNSLGMKLVQISPGSYRRGFDKADGRDRQFQLAHQYSNSQDFNLESPSHIVELTKPFAIGVTEVTVAQFRAFVESTNYTTDAEKNGGALGCAPDEKDYVDRFRKLPSVTWQTPGFDQTDDHPVVGVSWNDAVAFCEWLSAREEATYRLPTEAEWEYACRAGQTTWYSWGNEPDEAYAHANVADAALEAVHPNTTRYQRAVRLNPGDGDGVAFTAKTGRYKANPWGLHDMHGNVWEWCLDRWAADLFRRQMDGVPWPKRRDVSLRDPVMLEKTDQHAYGDWRSIRGGAWTCAPAAVRCSIRTYAEAGDATVYIGFRVVRQ